MLQFDHIVVGAGSAGCALAARLSADPAAKILLIEAGARRHPLAHIPGALLYFLKSGAANWGYNVDMGWRTGHRQRPYARGKLVGGSSAINGMLYVRGAPEDYDGWAALGNAGWSYRDVLPYFKRAETYLGAAADHRGTAGPLQVAPQGQVNPLTTAWLEAGVQAGLPFNGDINGRVQEGVGLPDFTLSKGMRSSAARAYLREPRQNLTIVADAQVTSIIFTGTRAAGVRYIAGGAPREAHADGEIILSAGAFNSPHLLMNSGIGDGNRLRALGIPVVVDLPGVGANLQDHPTVHVMTASREPVSLYRHLRGWGMAAALLKYGFTRKGPIGASGLEGISFMRSRPKLDRYDLHNHFIPILFTNQGRTVIRRHGFMTSLCLSRPYSRGRLTLRSADPLAPPLIDMNYLDDARDIAALRDGIRQMRMVLGQTALAAYRGEELSPGAETVTDAALDEFIAETMEPTYHAVGTCAMGTGAGAVVDEQLRVHGVDHLRVADASIMPRIVGGNTNAPTIMIGEKAADMILGNRAPAN